MLDYIVRLCSNSRQYSRPPLSCISSGPPPSPEGGASLRSTLGITTIIFLDVFKTAPRTFWERDHLFDNQLLQKYSDCEGGGRRKTLVLNGGSAKKWELVEISDVANISIAARTITANKDAKKPEKMDHGRLSTLEVRQCVEKWC